MEAAAASAGDSGAQTAEARPAEEAMDESTSAPAVQPAEETAIEAKAGEAQLEAAAPDAEPAQVEAEALEAEPAEADAEAARAEPAKVGAEAARAEPAEVEAETARAQPAEVEAEAPRAELAELEAETAKAEAAEVEAEAGAPQPVPEPQPVAAAPVAAAVGPAQVGAISLEAERPAERGLYELVWGTGLLTVAAIARKELAAIFAWPIAYLAWALVIVLTSIFGYLPQVNANAPVGMTGVFNWLALIMAFFVPLYTAGFLAGEQRSGSLEMLLTAPIRFWELVAGKWLGGFLFYAVTISFTLVYVMLMSAYQQLHTPATILGVQVSVPSVDYGAVVTGYAGILLVGAAWVALSVLASSLTQNQIVAAVAAAGALILLQYGFTALAGVVMPPLSDLLDYLAASSRAQSFNQGQIVLRDLVYFVTLTLGALFVTTRVVESRKWR